MARRAGRYIYRITFQKKVDPPDQDSSGATSEEYLDDFEWWAAYEPIGSREFPAYQKRFAETTSRFRIPYKKGINPGLYRIAAVFDHASPVQTQYFDIYPPLPVDGKRKTELIVEAVEIT